MELLKEVVDYILALGAPIFVPFIMIIAGLVVRMKFKDALSSAITLGVAFVGMSMLIGFMIDSIGEAAKSMTTNTGVELSIIDGGWTSMANISWGWPLAFVVFPLQVAVNIFMLAINKTNTFNADLWNVWGKIFTAFIVVAVATPIFGETIALIIAFVTIIFQIIIELHIGDTNKYRIEKLTGIPGITCTHRMILFAAVIYPFDYILRKIPIFNAKMDAAALREKIGIFAENHVIGFILGIVFGFVAQFDVAKTLMLGVSAATALTLFPMISKLFMLALSPISEAISDFMNKRYSGRKLHVGIDWPFLGGASEIWFTVIIAIPFILIWAVILPGNKILPFAGIINIALVVPAYILTNGNTLRMIILAIIGVPFFLFVGTEFAPMITELGNATKLLSIPEGELISNSSIDAPVFTYAFSFLSEFVKGNLIPLGLAIYWIFGYCLYSHELRKEAQEAAV